MRLDDITRHDAEHAQSLKATGFWGKRGAGSLFLAKSTRRFGIMHRALVVEQPGTWGTTGGAIDPAEDPRTAAIREAEEEVGYRKQHDDSLLGLDEFQSGTFRYTTFLYVVANEFTAKLNWEAQAFAWFVFGEWPNPLHFGLQSTLAKPECVTIIQTEIQKYIQTETRLN